MKLPRPWRRSERDSIIVEGGGFTFRANKAAQGRVRSFLVGKAIKVALPLVAAGVAALVAWLEVC